MPLVLAEELDTLTLQDIERWARDAGNVGGIHIEVIDKPGLTIERLDKLKSLVQQRDGRSGHRPIDAEELGARLLRISPRCSPAPSDAASSPRTAGWNTTVEGTTEFMKEEAFKEYADLKRIGGRPASAINSYPGPCPASKSEANKRYHFSDHWHGQCYMVEEETKRWLDFRWYQFRRRLDSKMFVKYEQAMQKYREENKIDWSLELHLGRQTKVDEWREYYIYEHRKRRALERELDQCKQELVLAQEKSRDLRKPGTTGLTRSFGSVRDGEIEREKWQMLQAQRELKMAQKRYEAVMVEDSLCDIERHMMRTQAEKGLELAQARFDAGRLSELEQLDEERCRSREVARRVEVCRNDVVSANSRLEQHDALLLWIIGQLAEVDAAYASTDWAGRHNRDLLRGWENYYVYMQEQLQGAEERVACRQAQGRRVRSEAEQLIADRRYPMRNVRPLKALLAWIDGEFPEIASGRPSSDDVRRDETKSSPPEPSRTQPGRKSSPLGKSTRRSAASDPEVLVLHQVRCSKVSKPGRKSNWRSGAKWITAHHDVLLSEVGTHHARRVQGQGQPCAGMRRSERLRQQKSNSAPQSMYLVHHTEPSFAHSPKPRVRRSVRIIEREKKARLQESDRAVKHAQQKRLAKPKSAQHIGGHAGAASVARPCGISKRRRQTPVSAKGESTVRGSRIRS